MSDAFSAIWLGAKEAMAALDKIAVQGDLASKTMIASAAALVVKETQAQFQGSHKKGEPHVGGAQPNIVTGMLRRSIIMAPIVQVGASDYQTTVGPSAIYGRRVELGYKGSAAYPFFTPGVQSAQTKFPALQEEIYSKFLR
jgi:hypothetical protein